MFSITQIAAAAVALAVGGTGSAALVTKAPHNRTKADVAATLTAKANADLSAAEKAQQRAIDALGSATAEGKATATANIAAASASLNKASIEMNSAVKTGSQTAIDAFADFSRKSVRLVNSLGATASVTANASLQASSDLVQAVDHQLVTARGVVSAQGTAAVAALNKAKADLPAKITATAGSTTGTVSAAVPQPAASANVSAGAQSSTTVSGLPVGVVSSTVGQLGVIVGQK